MTLAPSYIRKKATLAAVRIIGKCPELIENYIDKLDTLLSNEQQQRNHAVLITSLTLITEIVRIKTDDLPNAPAISTTNEFTDEQDKRNYVTKRYVTLLYTNMK